MSAVLQQSVCEVLNDILLDKYCNLIFENDLEKIKLLIRIIADVSQFTYMVSRDFKRKVDIQKDKKLINFIVETQKQILSLVVIRK